MKREINKAAHAAGVAHALKVKATLMAEASHRLSAGENFNMEGLLISDEALADVPTLAEAFPDAPSCAEAFPDLQTFDEALPDVGGISD